MKNLHIVLDEFQTVFTSTYSKEEARIIFDEINAILNLEGFYVLLQEAVIC